MGDGWDDWSESRSDTRDEWLGGLLAVAAILTFFVFMFGGIAALNADDSYTANRTERQQVAASNHFWAMTAGTAATDHSVEGRLAADLRTLKAGPKPADTIRAYYVHPNQYRGIESVLGVDVFSNDNKYEAASGPLTRQFAADVVKVSPGTLSSLRQWPPAPYDRGIATWGNYWLAVAAPMALWITAALLAYGVEFALFGLVQLRRSKARRQLTANLSPQAQEVLRIQRQLELKVKSLPPGETRRKAEDALAKAKEIFDWMTTERLVDEAKIGADTDDGIESLSRLLDEIKAGEAEGIKKLKSLGA
jgi:hypothetical protein